MNINRRTLLAGIAGSLLVPMAASRVFAADSLADRKSSGKLTIGIHNHAPWGYRDTDGNFKGYEPDIVREALAPLGIKDFEFVIAEFGALIPGLLAQRFDLIASGVSVTAKRCEQVIFSEPDLAVVDALVVKKGNPFNVHSFKDIGANPKFRMAGGRGSLNTTHAIDGGVSKDQITYLETDQDAMSAILAGRVDGMVTSAPSAMMLLKDTKLAGLERVAPFTGLTNPDGSPVALVTAVVFRPSDTDLRDAYNKRLAELKADGTVKKIMARYDFSDADAAPARSTAQLCSAA
jgi:polar amino acid transport system substrate-binding protein